MKYRFTDYSGLMTREYKTHPNLKDGISRDFTEVVEIVEEGLKIPYHLFPDESTPTYYLDTMIRVGDNIFYTQKEFLKAIEVLKRGMKLKCNDWDLVVIQIGYNPTKLALLITSEYCKNQVLDIRVSSDQSFDSNTTLDEVNDIMYMDGLSGRISLKR